MSEDARNSLIAFVAVSLFACFSYLALQVLKDIALPRWTPWACFALSSLSLAIGLWRNGRGAKRARN